MLAERRQRCPHKVFSFLNSDELYTKLKTPKECWWLDGGACLGSGLIVRRPEGHLGCALMPATSLGWGNNDWICSPKF